MGPLRFELRSEDPQSPRMARLPYGPVLQLLDDIIYVSCYSRIPSMRGKTGEEFVRNLDSGGARDGDHRKKRYLLGEGSDVASFELLDP